MNSSDGPKEACKTYVEQTKLLVTLASAFVVAPSAIISLLRRDTAAMAANVLVKELLWAELSFIASVFIGYITLGTIAGDQHQGTYNVYRPATLICSWAQIVAYLLGLGFFVAFMRQVVSP
jgi:hypothetical protein